MKKNLRSKVKVPNEGPIIACLSIFNSNYLTPFLLNMLFLFKLINKITVVCFVLNTDVMWPAR